MTAVAALASSRKSSERIFGYDVFISFALGEPPRGNFLYASDLTRRLQDAGLVVFFCEEELGYEDTLTASILKALANTKVLIVITNTEVLKYPRWIQTEVEQFRKCHPQRPIIPISLDGCLQAIAAEKTVVDNWHGFEKRKFIVEAFDGGASNTASLQTLNCIIASVGRLRANTKWRVLVVSIVLLLLVLTVISWRMKFAADNARDEALHKQHAANMLVVAAEQTNGEFLKAADRASESNVFPKSFQENIQQALFQKTVVADIQGVSSIKLIKGGSSNNFVLGSRYQSVRILPVSGKQDAYDCEGFARDFSNMAVSADHFFWVGYDVGTSDEGSAIVRRWPDCEALGSKLSRWEDMLSQTRSNMSLQSLVPLPKERLLVGWLNGRLEIYNANAQSISLPIKPLPLAAVWADSEGNRLAVLDQGDQLRLFDLEGKTIGSPMKLTIGKPERTTSRAWVSFFGNLADGKPQVLKAKIHNKVVRKDLVLIVVPEETGAILLLQYFEGESDPLLDAAVVKDEVTGCSYSYYLTSKRIGRVLLHDRCLGDDEERKVEVDYPRSSLGYTAGGFCQNGGFVVGDWEGNVYWMRYAHSLFEDLKVETEHVEHSWPDAVSGVACAVDDSAYVSFRDHGVKLFTPSWRLHERELDRKMIIPASDDSSSSDLPEKDVAWEVNTFHGPATLYLHPDQGDIELVSQEQLVWRKNFARPRAYETGDFTDAIQSVVMDFARNRFWVLTSFGRLSLVELNTGSILARFATNFFSAAQAIPSGFDKLVVSDQGGISFSYELNGKIIEVAVTPKVE